MVLMFIPIFMISLQDALKENLTTATLSNVSVSSEFSSGFAICFKVSEEPCTDKCVKIDSVI